MARRLLVGEESEILLRRDVAQQAVRHHDVLAAIQIEVADQRTPAPVGACHAGHLPDVTERAVRIAVLQHVAHELVAIVVLQLGLIHIPAVEARGGAQPVFVFRQHVGRVDVGPAVIVHVGDVHPHREVAAVRHPRLHRLDERPIVLVDVDVVVFEEIVRDVDVGPSVVIQIRHPEPKTEADFAAEDPRLHADVREVPLVVAIQAIAALVIALVARVAQPEAARGTRRVVDQDQVEVTIAVEVEEGRLRGVAVVVDAVLARVLAEVRQTIRADTVVDPEFIATIAVVADPGVADVKIEPAVAIHVGEREAGRPWLVLSKAGRRRDVAEAKFPFIEVQRRAVLIASEDDFWQPIARQVTDRDAAAVIEIAIYEHVHRVRLGDVIFEPDAGVRRRHLREEGRSHGRSGASSRDLRRCRFFRAPGAKHEHRRNHCPPARRSVTHTAWVPSSMRTNACASKSAYA